MALPSTKRFRDLLETQVQRDVALSPADPLSPAAPGLSFAVYVDDHLATRAVAVVDLAGAAFLGAAHGLVPVGVAEGAVADHALPGLLADRFRSLLQAWAPLFDGPGEGPARLYVAALPGEAPPRDVVSLAAAAGRRLDVSVAVRAYGRGAVSLVHGR